MMGQGLTKHQFNVTGKDQDKEQMKEGTRRMIVPIGAIYEKRGAIVSQYTGQ